MAPVKVGQVRRVIGTDEVILVTELETIPILGGDMDLVTYLSNGQLESSELTWVAFKTELINECG